MPRNLSREVRSELVLEAAIRVFAEHGYHGATTAKVASEAGISQGYVLHLFGTKEDLYLAALASAGETILAQMRAIHLEEFDLDGFSPLYGRTVLESPVMFILLQGFATCRIPRVGAQLRRLLADMYAVLVERTNATPDQARDYLARGLLINTVLAMGYREHAEDYPWVTPLISATIGEGKPFAEGAVTGDDVGDDAR